MGLPGKLRLIGATCAVLLAGLFSWFAYSAPREQTLRLEHAQTQNRLLAASLSEQAKIVFSRVETALHVMSTLFAGYLEKNEAARAAVLQVVRTTLEQAAVIDDLYLIDSNGHVQFESDIPSELRRYLQQSPRENFGFEKFASDFEISRVILGLDGKSYLLLTRQIVLDSVNRAIGSVIVRINLGVFQSSYDRIIDDSPSSIGLYRSDSLLLVGAPRAPDLLNRFAPSSLFVTKGHEPMQGSMISPNWQGVPQAIIGYAVVPEFPLFMTVSTSEDEVLAASRTNLVQTLVLLALAAVGLMALLLIVDWLFREQQRALLHQQASDRRIADIMKGTPAIVYEARADGTRTYVSQRWFETVGKPESPAGPTEWETFVHPDDIDGMRRTWQHAIAQGRDLAAAYRMRVADGTYRWHQSLARPARDTQGHVRAWFGALFDIEDQRQAELSYQDLYDGVPIGLFEVTASGKYVAINPAYRRLTGIGEGESLDAINVADLYVDPRDREIMLARLQDEPEVEAYKTSLRRRDGVVIEVEGYVRGVHSASGLLTGLRGAIVDRSAEARAEHLHLEAENRLRAIIEHMPDGLLTIDGDGRIVEANMSVETMFGYSPNGLTGQHLRMLTT